MFKGKDSIVWSDDQKQCLVNGIYYCADIGGKGFRYRNRCGIGADVDWYNSFGAAVVSAFSRYSGTNCIKATSELESIEPYAIDAANEFQKSYEAKLKNGELS